MKLLLIFTLCCASFAHAGWGGLGAFGRKARSCPGQLAAFESDDEAMAVVRRDLPTIIGEKAVADAPFIDVLEHFARPSHAQSPLVVVSILGGGNAGKSTLWQAIPSFFSGDATYDLDAANSSADAQYGFTRQMVALIGSRDPRFDQRHGGNLIHEDLRGRFPNLNGWRTSRDANEPGDGLLKESDHIPSNMAFIDPPDYDTNLDNQSRAKRVVRSADVLILMVEPGTIGNRVNRDMLIQTFKESGKKHVIFVYKQFPGSDETTKRMLVTFANEVYGTADSEYPDAVLGAYYMIPEADVVNHRKHPSLEPMFKTATERFQPFPDLLRQISENAEAHKRYALEQAVEMIKASVETELRGRVKSLLAAEIYRQAFDAVTESVALEFSEKFPYREYRDRINAGIRHQDKDPLSGYESYVDMFGSLFREFRRQIARKFAFLGGEAAKIDQEHRAQLQARQIVSAFTRTWRDGGTNLLNGARTKKLKAAVDAYYDAFPEEARNSSPGVDGHQFISLPDVKWLPERIQAALHRVNSTSDDAWINELSRELSTSQIESADKDRNVAGFIERRGLRQRAVDSTFAVGTVVASALALYHGVPHLQGAFESLADIGVAAGIFFGGHAWWDHVRDHRMLGKVQRLFEAAQGKLVRAFVAEKMGPALRRELNEDEPSVREAVIRVEQALQYLNPKYTPLSNYLVERSEIPATP